MSTNADQDKRLRLRLSVAVAFASLLILFFGGFQWAEDAIGQERARLLDRAPTGEIVIVEIDAKSLAQLNTWPWSRRLHARLVDALHGAGAEIIAFDVDFSAPSEADGDRAFAKAIQSGGPVILPIFQQRISDQAGDEQTVSSRPAAVLEAAWVGGVNIFPGADGIVRDYPAATFIDGQIQPSLATLLVDNSDLGNRIFQPDWSIDAREIPRYSFVDVIHGRVPQSRLAGKRVLVGATAVELGDRYTVPRFGVVPGVVVQGLAAESLLQGRAIMHSGLIPTALGVLMVGALLGMGRHRSPKAYACQASALALILVLGPLAVQAFVPVSIDVTAMLFAASGCIVNWVAMEVRLRARQRSQTDLESGLPNRLSLELVLVDEDETGCILATASIERFEFIRDTIGTFAVNQLIQECAQRISATTQTTVYRVSPDTFAWIVPNRASDLVEVQVELIERSLRRAVNTSSGPVDVLITVGLERGKERCSATLRIEHALAAIGRARTVGKSVLWYEGADQTNTRQLSMIGELRRGIEEGDVFLTYQPKLNLASGRISDAEALTRWQHPEEGFIPPDSFIPLAEATGVVRELTHFALETGLAACARWQSNDLSMRIAVNVSAADLASSGFVESVDRLLAKYEVSAASLAIEVTESAIIRSPEVAISVLGALRARGIRLAIDDYGTGQSTLTYLKELPVHELKIDKSFVTAMCTNRSDAIMVRSTIDLAHQLELKVVAEGVEDLATLNMLTSMGCDYAQGYFIGKPMTADALSELATGIHDRVQLSA